jgi:hypothetical protein
MSIKIDNVEKLGLLPANDLSREIKGKKNKDLIKIIDCVTDSADKKETRLWAVASKALAELHLRSFSKRHPTTLEKLKSKIEHKSGTTMVSPEYTIEVAGIERGDKILRPYPRTPFAEHLLEKWQKSKTSKPFDGYISKFDKKLLSGSKVHYLSRDERPKYEVSFKGKKISIGGKAPSDGTYIFALDSKGEQLLAGKKEKGVFQHTSFFAGKPVQSVGFFGIKHREIKKVFIKSGHYKPTMERDGKHIKEFLKSDARLGKKETEKLTFTAHKA